MKRYSQANSRKQNTQKDRTKEVFSTNCFKRVTSTEKGIVVKMQSGTDRFKNLTEIQFTNALDLFMVTTLAGCQH